MKKQRERRSSRPSARSATCRRREAAISRCALCLRNQGRVCMVHSVRFAPERLTCSQGCQVWFETTSLGSRACFGAAASFAHAPAAAFGNSPGCLVARLFLSQTCLLLCCKGEKPLETSLCNAGISEGHTLCAGKLKRYAAAMLRWLVSTLQPKGTLLSEGLGARARRHGSFGKLGAFVTAPEASQRVGI